MTTINGCDYGHEAKATRLDIGGNAGVYLCRKHWAEEMMWRKQRNEELELQNRFDIPPYPGIRNSLRSKYA